MCGFGGATDFVGGMFAIVDVCGCGLCFEMCGLSACVAAGLWSFKVSVCGLERVCGC